MHENIAHSSWNYPVKHPQAIADPQLACGDCCDECSAPFTPQCNEKCMIVPCYNQEYSGQSCHLLNEVCENVDCVDTIIPDCKGHRNADNCGDCYNEYGFDSHRGQSYVSDTNTSFQMDPSINHLLYDHGPQSSVMSSGSSPSSGSSVSSQADFMFSPKDTSSIASTVSMSSPPTSPGMHSGPLVCMWGDCHACFSSLNELVGHVNVVHLQPSTQRLPKTDSISQAAVPQLQCQWRDCHAPHPQFPLEQMFSSRDPFEGMLNILTNHLLHDHLVPPGNQSPLLLGESLAGQLYGPTSTHPVSSQHGPAKNIGTHPCHWKSCTEEFASLEELTTHITNTHVGSGKAQYECFWDDCNRNGTNGFSSKQKICRHIQSHTGHRPFQCKICNQNFSEAATLQQHMRRHTHEKPYVCDFPGCKKSFAIAGALTIHKRVHNGEKPFKCKYCDKAFAESSNLSKHLRTHTGVRPYTCPEPSCGKSFARPDQLTRHSLVHNKKRGSS